MLRLLLLPLVVIGVTKRLRQLYEAFKDRDSGRIKVELLFTSLVLFVVSVLVVITDDDVSFI